MKTLNSTFCYLIGLILIATVGCTTTLNEDQLTQDQRKLLNDYTSKAYVQILPSDLNMTKAELLEVMNIPEEKSKKYEFSFYKLDFGGLKELHATSTGKGLCYNVAIVNAGSLSKSKSLASLVPFSFFQDVPVLEEHTCSGVRCSSCGFTRDENNEITGCECLVAEGWDAYCNHSISEGG